jgi:hypothetical protein
MSAILNIPTLNIKAAIKSLVNAAIHTGEIISQNKLGLEHDNLLKFQSN